MCVSLRLVSQTAEKGVRDKYWWYFPALTVRFLSWTYKHLSKTGSSAHRACAEPTQNGESLTLLPTVHVEGESIDFWSDINQMSGTREGARDNVYLLICVITGLYNLSDTFAFRTYIHLSFITYWNTHTGFLAAAFGLSLKTIFNLESHKTKKSRKSHWRSRRTHLKKQ